MNFPIFTAKFCATFKESAYNKSWYEFLPSQRNGNPTKVMDIRRIVVMFFSFAMKKHKRQPSNVANL